MNANQLSLISDFNYMGDLPKTLRYWLDSILKFTAARQITPM